VDTVTQYSTLSISDALRLEDHAVHVATPLLVCVTMAVHSPTVRDIKTRGTVGNTVVHMHPAGQMIQNLTLRRVETKKPKNWI